jgi:hypothetical protein
MDSEWRDRLGSEALHHLHRFRLWMRVTGGVGVLGFGGVVFSAAWAAAPTGLGLWIWISLCATLLVLGFVATRHSRWIERDVANRLALGTRGSWAINLRSPARFDESVRKLRISAMKRE